MAFDLLSPSLCRATTRRGACMPARPVACASARASRTARRAAAVLATLAMLAMPAMARAAEAVGAAVAASGSVAEAAVRHQAPGLVWSLPFVALLLFIAILPLLPKVSHWWERNTSKLMVALAVALVTCAYYVGRGYGFRDAPAGLPTLLNVLRHAIVGDYVPFMVLLFSLYVISGGIRLSGDIPAHPLTNVAFLAVGAVLASLIGTTGAAMVLIRPLLQVNSERRRVKHTVIFFIFIVANVGGVLLPVGDPPLFLGYLRGVPFLWTLHLLPMWLVAIGALLVIYYVFELGQYRHEDKASLMLDETQRVPVRLEGGFNFLLLAGVVLSVALLVPGRPLPGTGFVLPNVYAREVVMLALAGLSVLLTRKHVREMNQFNYGAIAEVACLFIGIFVAMQPPIEILQAQGAALGISSPTHFFWASGALSSFLDNAPTYVVFFETAGALPIHGAPALMTGLQTASGHVPILLLEAISVGAVFMGANTYIGNGPNFLVKSIAESRGVKMPSFFGYMAYSCLILIPLFVMIDLIFFMGLFGK
jgi:Na+/H+ antiporter NhaD/arsenite permease-like protein